MAKIEYLKAAPGARRGDVRSVDDQSARALVKLGYARYRRTAAARPEQALAVREQPARTTAPAEPSDEQAEDQPQKKRQYKRRDLQAE